MKVSTRSLFCFLLALPGCAPAVPSRRIARATLNASPLIQRCGEFGGENEQKYLKFLTQRLSQGKLSYRFILVRCREPIALSIGERVIVLSKGLLEKVPNEAALVFVLAHEIIHDIKGHHQRLELERSLEDQQLRQRDLELEADREAIIALAHTGYDPRVAVDALAMSHRSEREIAGYPLLRTRIEQVRSVLSQIGWVPPGTVDRREFRHFQSRIKNL